MSSTITVTETVTETSTPSEPTCRLPSEVGDFKATASEYDGRPWSLYFNQLGTGSPLWLSPSSNMPEFYRTWQLDSEGYLMFRNTAAYISTTNPGTVRAQCIDKNILQNLIRDRPDAYSRIKGCVNSVTGELTLSAKGRTNILQCDGSYGSSLMMSSGHGEDVSQGSCIQVFPQVAL